MNRIGSAIRERRRPARAARAGRAAAACAALTVFAALAALTPAAAHGQAARSGGAPLLSIRFTPAGVEFSGTVESEEAGEALAKAARASRPGLAVLNRGLAVDPEAPLPSIDDLRSLVSELSVSTHEGAFAVWDDAVLLGGLTDSRIALTALQVRIAPILKGRLFVNRVCIVPSEDLPENPVVLSTGEIEGPLLDFELYPTAAERYVPPGLGLEKLFPALLLLADFERLRHGPVAAAGGAAGIASGGAGPVATLPPPRAVPVGEGADPPAGVAMPSAGEEAGGEAAAGLAALLAASAAPVSRFVELGSLRFSRNTALLQGNQDAAAAAILERLGEEGGPGARLLVQATQAREGDASLAEYLAERRAEEAVKLLVSLGIDASTVSVRNDLAPEAEVDEGEVRLVLEVPPPMEEPSPEDGEDGEDGEAR